ncbi:glutamate--cysteine ligase EgtA [Paractinoplanes ferrugineus]|uniref:Glutamate--cysteine ligase EgtA n=1 Tax=Paractinoplanes ferrugineus TaxID=113564 RepID=A0A919JB15_9ACTN|nr:glutamate--cysteine ligase EgtA [Actinoplanes ferrugineus]
MTEQAAELLIAHRAFATAPPGFVGAALDLPARTPPAPTPPAPTSPAGRVRLRHGFLAPHGPHTAVLSGPPSPGLDICLARMTEDLELARPLLAGPGAPVPDTAGIRIGLEAGLEGGGPLGLSRRWTLAHTLAPVLAAAFANTPGAGWRSVRQATRRHLPVLPPGAPRAAWMTYAMDAPDPRGRTLRARYRAEAGPDAPGLTRHLRSLRPPVAARGHLEIDVADHQPGAGWRIPVTIVATLLDDPRAALEASAATAPLIGEPRLWERAARDALTDPLLATAARDCFIAAYAALARQGAPRALRDAVADYLERYVLRSRTPADDILDRAAAQA